MKRTLGEIVRLGAEYLEKHGVSDAGVEAEYLVSSVLSLGRTAMYLNRDDAVGDDTLAILRAMISERAKGKPSSYLTGRRDFYGMEFQVDEHCLIPRRETEILVEEVIRAAEACSAACPERHVRILDIGCGCGNISVAVAKNVERALVSAVDISYGAVLKTCQNALVNGVYAKITAYRGDLFSPFENTAKFLGHFDIIVSNPPYISDGDIPGLSREVAEYEPRAALAGGRDGLDFYRRIIPSSGFFLAGGGKLFFEVGPYQKDAVAAILAEHGYDDIMSVRDYVGVDRVVTGRLPSGAGFGK